MPKSTNQLKTFVYFSLPLLLAGASGSVVFGGEINGNTDSPSVIHDNALNLLKTLKDSLNTVKTNVVGTAEKIVNFDKSSWKKIPMEFNPYRYLPISIDNGTSTRNIPYRVAEVNFYPKNENGLYGVNELRCFFLLNEETSCVTPEDTKKIFGKPSSIDTFLGTRGMECSTGFRDSLRYFYKYDNGSIRMEYSLKGLEIGDYTVSKEVHDEIARHINNYQNHKSLCAYAVSFELKTND